MNVVHLLDPGEKGTANVLEEGLATWFQDEPAYHDEEVRRYIANNEKHPPAYLEAEELVGWIFSPPRKFLESCRGLVE